MAQEDIPKTAFRCPGHVGLFEWIVMTFGLKNAGATYHRSMNFIFHEFISKLVEIYIDDVLVKSGDFIKHLADLRKMLECTRKHVLKMNSNKCAFGVSAGQFLGFMVHQRGIEISRRSIDAINKIVAPTNKTELQSLIGKINFIRQFISNLSGKIRAFSSLLKLKADQEFEWVSTKASRQSTLWYTHGSSLSADRCASYELDGDARHRQGFYPASAAVWA